MSHRVLIAVIILLLGALCALMALQWRIGTSFAVDSPQRVTVGLGKRALVGAGRAYVHLDRRWDHRAELWVHCDSATQHIVLRTEQTSDEICSVRIHLVGFSSETGTLATSRAHLEVTWDAAKPPIEEVAP